MDKVANTRYEILTKDGFKNFTGVKKTNAVHRKIVFDDGKELDCALTHRLIDSDGTEIRAIDVVEGQVIDGRKVISIYDYEETIDLYDALNVEGNATYLTNDINSHNCAFISKTLWDAFFTSTWPTISSGTNSKMTIVSCVTKNTYVYTNNGIQRIADYIDDNQKGAYYVPDYHVLGRDKLRTGCIMVNSGKAKTKIIKSKFTDVECSLEHKFYACKNGEYGWYKAKELEVGDYIAVQRGMNIWGNRDILNGIELTDDLMYLFGLYLAEGCIVRDSTLIITCGDDISEIFDKLHLKYTKKDIHYCIYNKELIKKFIAVGFDTSRKSKSKIIPYGLLQASRDRIKSLVQGMFDGDGCGAVGKVSYVSTSEELIDQLRIILMNFGIMTSKSYHKTKPTEKVKVESEVWTLYLSGRDSQKYFMNIGFRIRRKMWNSLEIQNKVYAMNSSDIVPYGMNIVRKHHLTVRCGLSVKKNKLHINRENMLSCRNVTDDAEWMNFFDKNVSEYIVWDTIKEIVDSENEVYDFSLNNENDFFAHSVIYNGYLGHQTPNGRNHFYDIWINAKNHKSKFVPSEVNWWEVPGRDEKWREEQLMVMSEEQFNTEYGNSFDAASNTLISPYYFKRLDEETQNPLQSTNKMRIYELPIKNHVYIATVDCADEGGDYSTISIIDITSFPYKQVAVYADNEISHINLPAVIKSMCEKYNECFVLVESNEIGTTVLHILNYDIDYGNIIKTVRSSLGTSILGQRTTKTTKAAGCINIKSMIEKNGIILPDKATVDEFRHFVKSGQSYAAEKGYHDDLVMGLVNFAYYASTPQFRMLFDTNFSDEFRERYEQDTLESLTPIPLFGNDVLNGYDREDVSWLR